MFVGCPVARSIHIIEWRARPMCTRSPFSVYFSSFPVEFRNTAEERVQAIHRGAGTHSSLCTRYSARWHAVCRERELKVTAGRPVRSLGIAIARTFVPSMHTIVSPMFHADPWVVVCPRIDWRRGWRAMAREGLGGVGV